MASIGKTCFPNSLRRVWTLEALAVSTSRKKAYATLVTEGRQMQRKFRRKHLQAKVSWWWCDGSRKSRNREFSLIAKSLSRPLKFAISGIGTMLVIFVYKASSFFLAYNVVQRLSDEVIPTLMGLRNRVIHSGFAREKFRKPTYAIMPWVFRIWTPQPRRYSLERFDGTPYVTVTVKLKIVFYISRNY